MRTSKPLVRLWLLLLLAGNAGAQDLENDPFRQLEELLPTPSESRLASGAPGPAYWQQQVDYVIDVELDDQKQRIVGAETITYHNRSPHTLHYLWLQLDTNVLEQDSAGSLSTIGPDFKEFSYGTLRRLVTLQEFDGRMKVSDVKDDHDRALPHVVVGTMMRVDMPEPLDHGQSFQFSLRWEYTINDACAVWARTGYEHFEAEDDGNYLYEIAHWYPRAVAYTDVTGWQHKQFLGRGEFTLEFGNFLVRITVPDDHIVAASGELKNPDQVLTAEQQERLAQALTAKDPMFIVTPDEALANEKSPPGGTRTWVFDARNVRDFAFASSRKFIWDAQGIDIDGRRVMAMSYYPKEGEPLWSRYSTHSVLHTLEVYSKFTVPYPYPVAISVNGPIGGMEYPMICFNGPRPEEDGTYSKRTKYGLISVIIHEVGHNWFPMIINSDERQWTWMDEGLNTFVQFLAEQEWEPDYPSRRGEPKDIVEFMKSSRQVPIMTNSESLLQFGNNAYAKPATALNILRETVLGRELFDFAFKEYARRWAFKRPMPADFFRTMEDASGVDLDWFWRGWFYTTDHTDIDIASLRKYTLDTGDPDVDKPDQMAEREAEPETLTEARNKDLTRRTDLHPELLDFYNEFDELDVTESDRREFQEFLEGLEPEEREMLATRLHFYELVLRNKGGLVMPVILELEYEDGSTTEIRIPAEIWTRNARRTTKLLLTEKELASITLDPHLETADVDRENNHFPRKPVQSRFSLFKEEKKDNPMQEAKKEAEPDEQKTDDDATDEAEKDADDA